MSYIRNCVRVSVKNILYLTDFSQSSDAALPFATALARAYDAKVYALHILMPDVFVYLTPDSLKAAVDLQEKSANKEMHRIEAQLRGLPHEAIVERARELWATLEPKLKEYEIDLIVLGTHGRTGLQKFLLGSAAEKILRRSGVPVMAVGPKVPSSNRSDACFHRVLFATDFTPASVVAAPYAISLAQESRAELVLLHVMEKGERTRPQTFRSLTVAEALHQLHESVPPEAQLWCRPETVVVYGEPTARILETAKQKGADLIVMGIRNTGDLFTATHLESTAHRVIAHAECPVITVRGERQNDW